MFSNVADDGRCEVSVDDDTYRGRYNLPSCKTVQSGCCRPRDIDVDDPKSPGAATKRAPLSAAKAKQLTPDPPMSIDLQLYIAYTNKPLHGPGVLRWSSSSAASSLE